MPTYYRLTTTEGARDALAGAFRDAPFGPVRGVWVSDRPLDAFDIDIDRKAGTLIEIELDFDLDFGCHEIDGPPMRYREWLVPAVTLNEAMRNGTARVRVGSREAREHL